MLFLLLRGIAHDKLFQLIDKINGRKIVNGVVIKVRLVNVVVT